MAHRSLTIYQTYNTQDMAGSDAFHSTLAEVRKHLRACYGIRSPIKLDAKGEWEGPSVDEDGDEGILIYVQTHKVKLTRAGLCAAFEYIPNR